MNPTLYQSYAALSARIQTLTILANNLANTNSVAYKGDRVFEETLRYAAGDGTSGASSTSGPGVPVTVPRSSIDFAVGAMTETGNPLNVAMLSQGFFAVQTPQGERYTRQGTFQLNKSGQLQTAEGLPVLGDTGPIQITGNGVLKIDDTGHIALDGVEVGRLKIVDFKDRQKLVKEGMSLFNMPDAEEKPVPAAAPNLKQGALESSNVNPVAALTEMMVTQREFESMQRTIQLSMNDMTLKLIDEAGKR
jgi:flagellar basal-body rod protein FlgG